MFRYSFIADQLLKALTHKYIRRVPKGVTKTGATRYMYYYAGQEGHGKGVAHESELVQGASFAFGEHGKSRYHAHITKVDGDKLTIKYDDGDKKGKEETMTKKEFQALIHGEHKESIKQAQSKAEKQLQEAKTGKERGVKFSDKTMSKLEERVKNLQGLTQKQEQVKKEEKKKTTPKKKETKASEDDIVKNVTKETIGSVLNTDLLKFASTDKNRERLTGINVNLESKRFEAIDGYVMKLIDFPEGFTVDIVGSKEFINNTCCIPPKLVKIMAKHAGSRISFNTDDYKITVLDKKGYSLSDATRSVGMDGFPDIDTKIYDNFEKPDFTKNTLTLSDEDRNLLSSFEALGFTSSDNAPITFICTKEGRTKLEIDAFSVLPISFQKANYNKTNSKKVMDAIKNLEGVKLDSTYIKSNGVYLLRNMKTNELIGVSSSIESGNPKFDEAFNGMPKEVLDLLSYDNKNAPLTYDSHTIYMPTNIKSDVETTRDRTYSIKNIVKVASSIDKITVPQYSSEPSHFTNEKNARGLVMARLGSKAKN